MKKIILSYLFLILFLVSPILYSAGSFDQMYDQGMEAFKSGNFGSSELIFRKIRDGASSDDEVRDRAWFQLCRSVFEQQKYDAAIFEFNAFLNKCRNTDICTESRFWMGESYYYLKEYPKSIEEFKRYIIKNKSGSLVSSAHDRIGSIYYIQQRYDESILEWEHAISESSDKKNNALRILNIGMAMFKSGKYALSLDRLDPLLTSMAGNEITSKARLVIGQIFLIDKDYQKSLVILNGIPLNLLKDPPYYEANYFKAICYLNMGNVPAAKTFLDLFIMIGKDSEWYYDALFEMSKVLLQENDEKSEKTGLAYLDSVRTMSARSELRLNTARFLGKYYFDRDPEKAIPYLIESVTPENSESEKEMLLLLGKAYIKAGKFDDAEKIFDRYMEKFPFDAAVDEVTFLRARIFLEKKDISKAMELFESIQKNNPFSKYINESNYYLAMVNYRKENTAKALLLLDKYLQQNNGENVFDAHRIRAEIYIKTGNVKKGREEIDDIIKNFITHPGVEDIIFQYIIFLYGKGEKYAWYFNVLINRFPNSRAVMNLYLALANDYFQKKDYNQASEYYKLYLTGSIGEESGVAYFNRLISLYHIQKYEDVIAIIKKGQLPPLNEDQWKQIPLILARSYFQTNDFEKAYNVLKNSTLSSLLKEDMLLFVKSALQVNDPASAIDAAKLIRGDTDTEKNLYAESLLALGMYYMKKEKTEDAKGFLTRIIIECPGTMAVDFGRASLAEMYISAEGYKDAIGMLNAITNKDLQNKKNALLILSYFGISDMKSAVILSNKYVDQLVQSEHGEDVVRKNMEYYYNEKNILEFNRYSNYYTRYKGSGDYINYLTAKLYYDDRNYKNAYYFFYKLSQGEGRYLDEALFNVARLSLFIMYDKKSAVWYYNKLIERPEADRQLKLQSRLDLAIILAELNRKDESQKYLQEIIRDGSRGPIRDQALNLYEAYGYSDQGAGAAGIK